MRMPLAVAGLVPVLVALASCAPLATRAAEPRVPRTLPRLASEPLCSYRVLGTIRGRDNELASTGRGTPSQQARALGADAIIGYVPTPHYDGHGNVLSTSWTALAIAYWNRNDPNCYRRSAVSEVEPDSAVDDSSLERRPGVGGPATLAGASR